ncbi:MAG TPA: APC family permease [Rhizomicrobium sp.]|jgi:APA family basic amino acid/polyamine antiporter
MSKVSRGHLLRLLGASFGVAVGVGEMIGSGILRSPSIIAASLHDTGAILFLWGLGALHALLGANVFAELATALPRAGGAYVYAHRAFGDIGGLVVGWTIFVSHLAGIAAACVVFADFVGMLWPPAAAHPAFIAIAIQLFLYSANAIGLREGRAMQEATSLLKALMLFAFVGAALWLVPPIAVGDSAATRLAPAGFAAFVGAYQLIRGAYTGWDAPVYFAEENVEPARSIPRALLLGLAVTAMIYVLVNAALLYALGTAGTASSGLPFAVVLNAVSGTLASTLFVIGAMITVLSCANANIMIAPRVLFALSRDRLLPAVLQDVNEGGSPYFGFLLTAAITIALAATGGFRLVFGLIGILTSGAGLLTGIAFFVLRRREPDLPRPFRAFLFPWLPALLVGIDGTLLVLFAATDRRGAIFAACLCLLCAPLGLIGRRTRGRPPA